MKTHIRVGIPVYTGSEERDYLAIIPQPRQPHQVFAGVQHTFHGWLFQARSWREYVAVYDGVKKRTSTGVHREWIEQIGQWTREECMARARYAVEQARAARLRESA